MDDMLLYGQLTDVATSGLNAHSCTVTVSDILTEKNAAVEKCRQDLC